MKYRTVVRDLVIKNSGDGDAEDLRFRIERVDDDNNNRVHLEAETDNDDWVTVGDLTEGSSRSWTCIPLIRRADIRVITKWVENGQLHEKTFTTTVN